MGVGNIVSDLQKASTNDSAHARMRLPSIRFFNRVCVCIKGQPCWCKTRTRGDSSSVSTHSLLPRSGTGLIPHKVYIPCPLFFHLYTHEQHGHFAQIVSDLPGSTSKDYPALPDPWNPGTFAFWPLLPEGEKQYTLQVSLLFEIETEMFKSRVQYKRTIDKYASRTNM